MKEYKVMVKSIKDGKWYRAHVGPHIRAPFKSEEGAVLYAEAFIAHERKKEYPSYSEYKIMTREVTPWEDLA